MARRHQYAGQVPAKSTVTQDPQITAWGEAVEALVRDGVPLRVAVDQVADRAVTSAQPGTPAADPTAVRPGLLIAYRARYLEGLDGIDELGRQYLAEYLDAQGKDKVSGRKALTLLEPIMGLGRTGIYDAFGARTRREALKSKRSGPDERV